MIMLTYFIDLRIVACTINISKAVFNPAHKLMQPYWFRFTGIRYVIQYPIMATKKSSMFLLFSVIMLVMSYVLYKHILPKLKDPVFRDRLNKVLAAVKASFYVFIFFRLGFLTLLSVLEVDKFLYLPWLASISCFLCCIIVNSYSAKPSYHGAIVITSLIPGAVCLIILYITTKYDYELKEWKITLMLLSPTVVGTMLKEIANNWDSPKMTMTTGSIENLLMPYSQTTLTTLLICYLDNNVALRFFTMVSNILA